MPPGVVYVGRGSKWGNPYKVGVEPIDGDGGQTVEESIWAFRALTLPSLPVDELRGKDLACWCPLDAPCHADCLLKAANK